MKPNSSSVDMAKIRAPTKAPPMFKVLRNLGRFMKYEADAAHAFNDRSAIGTVYLAAKPADMHIHEICLRHESVVPYLFQQHGAGHHLPRAPHEVFQQLQFA